MYIPSRYELAEMTRRMQSQPCIRVTHSSHHSIGCVSLRKYDLPIASDMDAFIN
jgi:hypothetical protein